MFHTAVRACDVYDAHNFSSRESLSCLYYTPEGWNVEFGRSIPIYPLFGSACSILQTSQKVGTLPPFSPQTCMETSMVQPASMWGFPKIRAPNLDAKISGALTIRTPKTWTPQLMETTVPQRLGLFGSKALKAHLRQRIAEAGSREHGAQPQSQALEKRAFI